MVLRNGKTMFTVYKELYQEKVKQISYVTVY